MEANQRQISLLQINCIAIMTMGVAQKVQLLSTRLACLSVCLPACLPHATCLSSARQCSN